MTKLKDLTALSDVAKLVVVNAAGQGGKVDLAVLLAAIGPGMTQADRDSITSAVNASSLADATSRQALARAILTSATFIQADAPPSPDFGDRWIAGATESVWNGTAWQALGGGAGSGLLGSFSTDVTAPLSGDAASTWQTVASVTYGANSAPASQVLLIANLVQAYADASAASIGFYGIRILVDGVIIAQVNAGMFANETPSLIKLKSFAAGPHTYQLQWRASKAAMQLTAAPFSALLFVDPGA